MKKRFCFTAMASVLALVMMAACASAPQSPQIRDEYVSDVVDGILMDSKTKSFGVPVPEWVATYGVNGMSAVERMTAYKDLTVFIGEETGTNLQALQAWGNTFSANALISQRLKTTFESTAKGAQAGSTGSTTSGAPPANFDNYMEAVLEAATKATFSGARKENDWWGKYRYYRGDGKTVDREEYRFYILVTMDKTVFDRQLESLLAGAAGATYSNTEERDRAIDLVRKNWSSGE
jgi:hypothetical protein